MSGAAGRLFQKESICLFGLRGIHNPVLLRLSVLDGNVHFHFSLYGEIFTVIEKERGRTMSQRPAAGGSPQNSLLRYHGVVVFFK